jgi:ferredoxin-NADP reductase
MQNKIYYISGPEEMVMELEEVIWNLGVPEENTKRDYFPGYGNY